MNQPAVQVSYSRKKPLKTCWELAWMQKYMLTVMNWINIKWKNIPDCGASEKKSSMAEETETVVSVKRWA